MHRNTKEALANAPLLSYPHPDTPTWLMTDASDTAVGAVLEHINGTWHPISFFSRKTTPAETWYSTFDRELLPVFLLSSIISISLKVASFTYSLTTNLLPFLSILDLIAIHPVKPVTSITFPNLPPLFRHMHGFGQYSHRCSLKSKLMLFCQVSLIMVYPPPLLLTVDVSLNHNCGTISCLSSVPNVLEQQHVTPELLAWLNVSTDNSKLLSRPNQTMLPGWILFLKSFSSA